MNSDMLCVDRKSEPSAGLSKRQKIAIHCIVVVTSTSDPLKHSLTPPHGRGEEEMGGEEEEEKEEEVWRT